MDPEAQEEENNISRITFWQLLALPEADRESLLQSRTVQLQLAQDISLWWESNKGAIAGAAMTGLQNLARAVLTPVVEVLNQHRDAIIQGIQQAEQTLNSGSSWIDEYEALEDEFLAPLATELGTDIDYLMDNFTIHELIDRVQAIRDVRAAFLEISDNPDDVVEKIQRAVHGSAWTRDGDVDLDSIDWDEVVGRGRRGPGRKVDKIIEVGGGWIDEMQKPVVRQRSIFVYCCDVGLSSRRVYELASAYEHHFKTTPSSVIQALWDEQKNYRTNYRTLHADS